MAGLVAHVLTKNRNSHSVGDLDGAIEIVLHTQINDEAEVKKPAHGMEHNLGGGAGDVLVSPGIEYIVLLYIVTIITRNPSRGP